MHTKLRIIFIKSFGRSVTTLKLVDTNLINKNSLFLVQGIITMKEMIKDC